VTERKVAHGTYSKWKWDHCNCSICKAAKDKHLNPAKYIPLPDDFRKVDDTTFSNVWRDKAECRRHGPMDWKVEDGKTRYMTDEEWGAWTDRVFFPQRGGSVEEAREICARCPVQEQCFAAGLVDLPVSGSTPLGIWGGKSQRERRATRGRKWR